MSDLTFIHRYVPPKHGSSQTLLLLHGTGGNEEDLLRLGAEVAPSFGLLSPRGKVLEHGMTRFFRRFAEGLFDQEDLEFRTRELGHFLSEASERYAFDPDKVVALGYSNGANIAASLLLRSPGSLMGGALLHAMVPFIPITPPDLTQKQIFLGGARNDPIVHQDETRRLRDMLTSYGATVQTGWFTAGHGLSASELAAVAVWLEFTKEKTPVEA
jgi:predicted esterase